MANADSNSFEARLTQHLARSYRGYAIAVGLLWVIHGGFRGAASIAEVSKNGLGRYATQFGLDRLPGNTSVTGEDIFFFTAILAGAAILVVSGCLLPLQIRPPIYSGIAGAALLILMGLPLLVTGFAVLPFAVPVFIMFTGLVLHVALREKRTGTLGRGMATR